MKDTMETNEFKRPRSLDDMPQLMDAYDLVELGLYATINMAYVARCKGEGPSYVKLNTKVLYPKEAIRDFIKNRMCDGSIPTKLRQVVDSL